MRNFAAIGVAVWLLAPLFAEGANLVHVRWEDLPIVAGKTVTLALLGGPVITAKATAVESDALVVKVTKTTDPKAYPKGELRVLRATLHVFQMRTDVKIFRLLLTPVGAASGLLVGLFGGVAIDWHDNHDGAATAVFIAGGAGGTIAGYLAGQSADRRWTTVEIVP